MSLTRSLVPSLSALLLTLSACGSFQSYRLPVSAEQGRAFYPPLAACASQRSLQAVEHPDSFNVRFDSETWVQFMAQNQQFNMVILLGKAVPEPERPARFQAAKAAGDELFQCATSSVVAPALVVPPPPPG